MQHIYTLFTVLIVLLNIAGLSILFSRLVPYYTLARSFGVVIVTSVMFFIEHFFGLGDLAWVWPITSAASVYLLWKNQDKLKTDGFIGSEIVFYLGFFYCLMWRFTFPDFPAGFSEHLTDLYFIMNYMQGTQLPPVDMWHPPYDFDFYYAFMHYGAALLGRIFGLDGGYAYHLGFSLLVGCTVSLGWFFTAMFSKHIWTRVMLVALLTFGGTGVAPLSHFLMDEDLDKNQTTGEVTESTKHYDNLWNKFTTNYCVLDVTTNDCRVDANGEPMYYKDHGKTWTKLTSSVRFGGNFEKHINTEFGLALFPELTPEEIAEKSKILDEIGFKNETFAKREFPAEIFSYQLYLGDYHPPVGGYFLLMVILACIGFLERQPDNRLAQAMIIFTMPLILITNSWVFPLQVLFTGGWILYRYVSKNPPNWGALFAGGLAATACIYPFMEGFGTKSLDTPIRLVESVNRTPINVFLAIFWPMILLAILSVVDFFWSKGTSEQQSDGFHKRHLVLMMGLTAMAILLFSELLYVDDPTGGASLRTNTTMKWWGWLWVAAMMSMAGALISSPKKAVRWITSITVLLVTVPYAFDLARVYIATPSSSVGKLQGSQFIEVDSSKRDLLNYLKDAPDGIVLESNKKKRNDSNKWAYTDTTVIPLFAGKVSAYGWRSHLVTWNGNGSHFDYMFNDIEDFYDGKHPEPLEFILHHDVQYVVWTGEDSFRNESDDAWLAINEAIKAQFHWRAFYSETYRPWNKVGVWARIK